jgi:hypothetical protein
MAHKICADEIDSQHPRLNLDKHGFSPPVCPVYIKKLLTDVPSPNKKVAQRKCLNESFLRCSQLSDFYGQFEPLKFRLPQGSIIKQGLGKLSPHFQRNFTPSEELV